MNIRDYLIEHRLHINSSYEEELVNSFCATTSDSRKRRLLQDWFQGYIYTVTLGILHDRRIGFEPGEKQQKAQWSGSYVRQYEFIVSHLLCRKDILAELKLFVPTTSNTAAKTDELLLGEYFSDKGFNEDTFYKSVFLKIKDICDEYMNGGLEYLKEKQAEGVSFVDELDVLVNLLHTDGS